MGDLIELGRPVRKSAAQHLRAALADPEGLLQVLIEELEFWASTELMSGEAPLGLGVAFEPCTEPACDSSFHVRSARLVIACGGHRVLGTFEREGSDMGKKKGKGGTKPKGPKY